MSVKILVVILILVAGCETAPTMHQESLVESIPKPAEAYSTVLNHWTDEEKNYRNFTSNFQVIATFLAPDLIEQQLYLDAGDFHWTAEKYRDERQRVLYQAETSATVFVDVYTEKDENNNLDKTKSDWSVFLDAGGKRVFPQSIKRIYDSKVSVVNKYPYHTLWSRPYVVTFPISTSVAISGPLRLVLAGPAGDAHLAFPNIK